MDLSSPLSFHLSHDIDGLSTNDLITGSLPTDSLTTDELAIDPGQAVENPTSGHSEGPTIVDAYPASLAIAPPPNTIAGTDPTEDDSFDSYGDSLTEEELAVLLQQADIEEKRWSDRKLEEARLAMEAMVVGLLMS